ncbi:hypothetical protein [Streptomyces sp. NRRL B-24484]|uniref:hypothetical protein n=1 Tax=Streptomyces sp. NRRL B-24484 TaxID=1463833 RepID=UPI001331B61B|nr:hypothetical protein [Streptomyces sp. NRRL B-24484]
MTRSLTAPQLAEPLGPTHHNAPEAATTPGSALAAQRRDADPREHLTRCATAWREHFGPGRPRTCAAEAALAALPGSWPQGSRQALGVRERSRRR